MNTAKTVIGGVSAAVKAIPAIISLIASPVGTATVRGKVESWKDYGDGDQIQVKVDGDMYLVHSANVALIKEG